MTVPLPDEHFPTPAPKPSALRVARLRAAHQLLDVPLVFADPLALTILGPVEEAALRADPVRYNAAWLRSLRASLVVRSRLAEDEWVKAQQRGVRQMVILGAGLDTFAYRNPDTEGCRIFEVDLPSTQQWKRDCLRTAGIPEPASLTFVPLDFETSTLADALTRAGFRSDAPAFFSWLGVTMYLEETAIMDTLRFITSLAPASAVIFDYAVLPALLSPREQLGVQFISARTAGHGEPWKTFFAPATLAGQLHALGFSEVQDLDADALHARYLPNRSDGLRKSGVSRLICATV